jgi:hypothetical protein
MIMENRGPARQLLVNPDQRPRASQDAPGQEIFKSKALFWGMLWGIKKRLMKKGLRYLS